jgi:hypothetical protein
MPDNKWNPKGGFADGQKIRPPPVAKHSVAFNTNSAMNDIKQGGLFIQAPGVLDLFYQYLPPKPYCTEFLGQLKIRPKETAVKDPYIQPNPITRAYWMVFDLDSGLSRYWPDERHIPAPNIEAVNRENNHRHVFYMIDPAVYTLRQARRRPLELAADVDKGLTRMLGADPGYGKLISKNPLSARWAVWVWHEKAWGLTELLDYIPDTIKSWKPRRKEITGLGRNCAVFDLSRVFAYSEWRRLRFGDPSRLLEAVFEYSMNINNSFSVPMTDREVRCIARSISKWTSRHMTAQGMRDWGERNRKRSLDARQAKGRSRAEEIRAYYGSHPDITRKGLALMFDVSEKTIQRLKVIRKKQGTFVISGL